MDYQAYANVAKALSDPKRVKILDMLSCGEMCACDILEHFDFTQPTLSHHVNVLVKAGLVTSHKKGTWHHYAINEESANRLVNETIQLLSGTVNCVCLSDQSSKVVDASEKTSSI